MRISTERQTEILAEVATLIRERAERDAKITTESNERTARCEEWFATEHSRLKEVYEREAKELDVAYVHGLEKARHHYELGLDSIRTEIQTLTDEQFAKTAETRDTAELSWKQTRALAIENYQNDMQAAAELGEQSRDTVAGYEDQMEWLRQQTQQMLRRRSLQIDDPPPSTLRVGTTSELLKRYAESARVAHERLEEVAKWRTTRFLDEGWPLLIFFLTFVFSIFPFRSILGGQSWHWLAASGGMAAALAVVSKYVVHFLVRAKSREPLTAMQAAVVDAADSVTRAKVTLEREHEQRLRRLENRRKQQLEQADETHQKIVEDVDLEQSQRVETLEHRLQATEKQLESRWEEEARPFRDEFPPKIESRKQLFVTEEQALVQRKADELEKIESERQSAWDDMAERYNLGMADALGEVDSMMSHCDRVSTPYEQVDWQQWKPVNEDVPALRFGDYFVDLQSFEGGLPDHERLQISSAQWNMPAVVSFPESPSLLIKAVDEGRDQATRVLRNVMLRMLTTLPAGKVRFTIVDPTGLGQNFSEFMHLADYDERLVASRIWTESSHINKRLTDLTEHMENVIQKYLRNEFQSIQEYNHSAGEVAEAFQVLVIANFPANFSEETARRLVSIATSGARCGVYVLMSADMKMAMPRNFDLADLEAHANTIAWNDGEFEWQSDELKKFPLAVDAPAEGDTLTQIVRSAGEHAKDANRVEVPFDAVVPPSAEWWTYDSRHEIEVPLGRAGATKLQTMHLGKGTSQHVLISGKTGSGKSTLLHAAITNLAIHYSPKELEFFLVDFKKGVEFKTYAQMQMPHARVVAIESEREFGLSVLQRLDEELKNRGEIFRDAGVQGLGGFRDIRPDVDMPRQLLIVDEFQEFFVKDDKIASEASLLLDRLVRQGRAFGIHVLLGSQTLAGAYSLARATLGQMAVRIALQCSEADAHLILSEDNTAARLLSRPGEAIYNNANGLFEGNHPFQVVWLPDSQREDYLRKLGQMADERQMGVVPPIVFEGNVSADPSRNVSLVKLLRGKPTASLSTAPKAWLGSAISIKEPAHVVLRRQAGGNVLVCGQQEELAAGILGGCIVSLAACQPKANPEGNRSAKFYVLDGGGFEAEDIGLATRMSRKLPLEIEHVNPQQVDETIGSLANEVTRRLESPSESRSPIYLTIYNLSRFRSLRKSDDDYGLGGFGDEETAKTPAQSLVHVMNEGPAVGVHVLIWCDTYNNVTRWFERGTLRDIAHRILFQMSATDSSNLMDSAAASQLGQYRAIYYSDEQGEFERFRPYGPPTSEWLESVSSLLASAPDAAVGKE